ncbi:MAG: DUF2256 domain-containing protein [Planctomycetota bacterium]|nr:MAG: DUF2256 domain-containing protein [Planctomycetota bacterium]
MTRAAREPRGRPRPTKICAACGRPFEWRKKWESCWEQVRYCSDRCRRARRLNAHWSRPRVACQCFRWRVP